MRRTVGVVALGLAVGLALAGCTRAESGAAPSPVPAARVSSAVPVVTMVPQAAPVPAPEPSPCAAGVVACVRLSTAQAWLTRPGQAGYGPVRIGYGVGVNATPVGTFAVSWKAERYVSRTYHEPMPYAVFFAPGGVAFHQGSLDASSHGCVHLAADAAALFFATLRRGDAVQVLP